MYTENVILNVTLLIGDNGKLVKDRLSIEQCKIAFYINMDMSYWKRDSKRDSFDWRKR